MTVTISKKITGFSVKKPTTTTPAALPPARSTDQRLVLNRPTPGVAHRSLRWPKRPHNTNGFPSWTSPFFTAPGGKFAMAISHYVNGVTHPFEVWALGREAPPEADVVCKILSKVMQTNEPAFIRYHLDALSKAIEQPFEIVLPHTGETLKVGSVGAAIAKVVEAHARSLGYFTAERLAAPSSMLDAMTSTREMKTEGRGGFAFYEDIRNPTTGDDFVVFLKELTDHTGATMPFSAWFGGRRVPAESESILKLLSLAMRHRDPAWTTEILGIVRRHTVIEQEFRGPAPRCDKQVMYGSTWAAVAEAILARYRELGILNEENGPVQQESLFAPDPDLALPAPTLRTPAGRLCSNCGEHAVQRRDGCDCCGACGASKCG
jgi:ribonucleoside-diphosphate reductase alpha chain